MRRAMRRLMKEIVMTDIDNAPLRPEPPMRQPARNDARTGSSAWRRAFALVGVLTLGLALGAGGFAFAAAEMDPMSFHHGARLAIVQRVVAHALDAVGATSTQEAKIHDIIAARFAEIAPNPKEHEAMRAE